MQKCGCALLLAAMIDLFSHQSRAQTAVDVSGFDIAGIKLRMPISDVAAVFTRLQEQDGGEILLKEEFDKALNDYHSMKEIRYFGYSSEIYKIGVTFSPSFQKDGKSFPPSVIDVLYVIKSYKKDSGAREHVLERYGVPTFDNILNDDIKYCKILINDSSNNKICDTEHGNKLFFLNGRIYLSDKDFEEFTKTYIVSSSPSKH
jgi:hypothetical protein